MKVQLIVVQGKPEGKTIPLLGPVFRIGRGETCHLRPNSEQVSREHAEFAVSGDKVTIKDLGSRNGTLVNGKAIAEESVLKDRDLVQVGPLTFAVSIQATAAPAVTKSAPAVSAAAKPLPASPDDISTDDIDSWLVSDSKNPTPERPSGVYGGETITITAFKDDKPKAPQPAPEEKVSDEANAAGPDEGVTGDDLETLGGEDEPAAEDEAPEEFLDASNPFHVKKKKPEEASKPSKPTFKDSSDAASEILRKMMERRKSSK